MTNTNTGLNTIWINAAGAEGILRDLGVLNDAFARSVVSQRTRSDYVAGVLFELAAAVAAQSSNPAATEPDPDRHFYSPADDVISSWARNSADELERQLSSLEWGPV